MACFHLIPQPKELRCLQGSVAADHYCVSEQITARVPKATEIFPYTGSCPVTAQIDGTLGREAYTVSVSPEGIRVTGSTPNGIYYALTTLRQLADLNDGQIPCCEITDEPDMKIRGYSDDISRGQISTLQNFKDIIRRLSQIKCNLYMPYIEDTFRFDCIPESGRYSDPVSKEEWRELCAYAKDYYVQITPIINVLGHWNKNATLREFKDKMLRTADGKICGALDARKAEVQEMVCQMLDEAIEVFGDSAYIHAGGDEVAEYTTQFGKDLAKEYYNGHFKMIHDHLASKGKKLMMYSDMYTPVYGDYQLKIEAIDEMPEDITFVFWDYACRAHYDNIDRLIAHGKKFLISPATHSWNRFLPQHYASWLNTKSLAHQTGAASEGLIMSSWCDGGMSLREENWFGLYCQALYAWNSQAEQSYEEVVTAYYKLFFGVDIDLQAYRELFDYDMGFLGERKDEPIEFWYCNRFAAGNQLCSAFWEPAFQPADKELKEKFSGSRAVFEKAYAYFSHLPVRENQQAHEAFLFDLRRSIAAARKLELQRVDAYDSREDAMADIPRWEALAEEIRQLQLENEKVWKATNRQSEWLYAQSRYEDLYDSVQSVIRYCKYSTRMTATKHL